MKISVFQLMFKVEGAVVESKEYYTNGKLKRYLKTRILKSGRQFSKYMDFYNPFALLRSLILKEKRLNDQGVLQYEFSQGIEKNHLAVKVALYNNKKWLQQVKQYPKYLMDNDVLTVPKINNVLLAIPYTKKVK